MRILMVRLSSIGDIVHTLPALAALRQRFPDAEIDWLVETKFEALLASVTGLDRVIDIDTFRWRRALLSVSTWRDIKRAVGRIRDSRYDVVLDLQGTIKSSVASRLARGARRIGFSTTALKERPAAAFYSEHVSLNGEATHVIDRHLRLLHALEIDTAERAFPLAVPEHDVAAAKREIDRMGVGEFILINPGGNWVTKRWSPEKFGSLAKAIRDETGLSSLVLWGPQDEAMARAVVASSSGASQLAPPTGILSLIPYARRARLFISGDTGPMHLASAFDVPIVGIFGPTDSARNGPFGAHDEVVMKEVPCGPCYKTRCPGYDNVCMTRIEVEDVMAAVKRQLERSSA